jgi:hypothetical protein
VSRLVELGENVMMRLVKRSVKKEDGRTVRN